MKNIGPRLSDQWHTHTVTDVISRLGYDPSVNQTAESYFTTEVNKNSKSSQRQKLDGSLKYNGAT